MSQYLEGSHDASGISLAIVVARFNEWVTELLLAGALEAINDMGGDASSVPVARVPGSLELGVTAKQLAASHEAVICLGAVIKGETDHYETVVDGTRQAVVQAGIDTGVPVIFGILTVRDREHAAARITGDRHAGVDAARAAVEMARLMRRIKE
jgi:6,7-dimethyl-8-ribityllumazine synthase